MIGAIITQPLGLQLLDPGCDNGTQGLHSKLVQSTTEELLQFSNVTDVECVRLLGCDLDIPVILPIFLLVIGSLGHRL